MKQTQAYTYRVICHTCRYHLHTTPRNFPTPLLLKVADCRMSDHEMKFEVLYEPQTLIEDTRSLHRKFLRMQGRGL